MKMNKKKVFTLALAVCLIAILSMSSLAWFSAEDSVNNDFLFATDEEGKTDFSVDVWEAGDTDDNGLEYTNILPGDELSKKAHVENTGAYDQYIRVLVEISDATALRAALGTDYKFEECFVGCDLTQWYVGGVNYFADQDVIVVVLYYNDVLEAGKEIKLFDAVKIPEELTVADANALGNEFSITVKAHAIQAANVGDDVWAAFNTVVGWNALAEYTNP